MGDLSAEPVMSQYKMTVTAVDGGLNPLESSAVVNLRLPSNVAPKFDKSTYIFTVPEDIPIGSSVGQVIASDSDTTKRSYHLEDSMGEWT